MTGSVPVGPAGSRLVIVGAGGHAREILDIVEALNRVARRWDVVGFVSDGAEDAAPLERRSVPVIGDLEILATVDAGVVVAIGWGAVRRQVVERLGECDYATLVHPAAEVHADSAISEGVVVAAGGVIGSGTALGHHAQINVNAQVGSGCTIGGYSTVSPGCRVDDRVELGAEVFLGAGCHVRSGPVGSGVVIGAGAVIDGPVAAGATLVGRPARRVDHS